MILDASLTEEPEPEPEWRTGTAIDEFTPIYVALGRGTKQGRYSPTEVDAMDLTVVAVALGIGADPDADDMRALAEMGRKRQAGEQISWDTWGK